MPVQDIRSTNSETPTARRFRSLTVSTLIVFLSLGLVILIVNNGLSLYFNFKKEQSLIISRQIRISQDAANLVKEFIDEKFRIINQVVLVNDLVSVPDRRELVLGKLIGQTSSFRQLLLIDVQGKELQKVSRLSSLIKFSLEDKDINLLLSTVGNKKNYISEVHFDQYTQEPIIAIAVPIVSIFGDVQGALIAEVNLKFMWDLISEIKIGEKGLAYVVDKQGNLLAFRDVGQVLKRDNLKRLDEVRQFVSDNDETSEKTAEISKGIQGNYVVSSYSSLGNPNWAVITELPVGEAYQTLIEEVGLSTLIIIVSALATYFTAVYLSNKITRPIIGLTKAVARIGKSKSYVKIEVNSDNEVGILADTFNLMTTNLYGKIQELHDEQAKLKASINSFPMGFVMTDIKENIVVMNGIAKSILCLKSDSNSYGSTSLKDLEHSDCSLQEIEERLKGIFDIKFAMNKVIKECKLFEAKELALANLLLRIVISPITVKDGEKFSVIGAVILVEDITEAKLLERSRDEFFSIASHELRTPLTAIKGNTSMLLDYFSDQLKNPQMKEMVDDVHESSIRLISIVNDFLDTSRLEMGKMEFKREIIDFSLLIPSVIKEYQVSGSRKKLYIHFENTDKIPPAVGDSNRVKQILINLIGNGLKFTEKGGITISVRSDNKFVKVLVADTGMGIPESNKKLLFRKFQQAESNILTRDVIRGTGLGLYISKMMDEGMGGKINLESSVVGKGTTFSFTLPIAKQADLAAAKAQEAQIQADFHVGPAMNTDKSGIDTDKTKS